MEYTGDKLNELLADYIDEGQKASYYRYFSMGRTAFLFSPIEKNPQRKYIFVIQHKLKFENIKKDFQWKAHLFAKLTKEENFSYSVQCFLDQDLGYLIFEIDEPFLSIQDHLFMMSPKDFSQHLLNTVKMFKNYLENEAIYTDISIFTNSFSEKDPSQPIIFNFYDLYRSGKTAYMKKSVYKGIKSRLTEDEKLTSDDNKIEYTETIATETIHVYTLGRLLSYYTGKYFKAIDQKYSGYLTELRNLSSNIFAIQKRILSKEEKLPSLDELEEVISSHISRVDFDLLEAEPGASSPKSASTSKSSNIKKSKNKPRPRSNSPICLRVSSSDTNCKVPKSGGEFSNQRSSRARSPVNKSSLAIFKLRNFQSQSPFMSSKIRHAPLATSPHTKKMPNFSPLHSAKA